ncbi:MAG TPA: NAD(P)/FAD-dependent oxidoreductase [Kofleriaceae bacterium]|nr:NAD(P)/FAD-dependent oxidoreductase [Kofleriaceae bacterium]
MPVDELRAIRREGISRRKLLAGAAAGAAGLALARPRRALAASQSQTVTIVGGGIAGLNCALTLRDQGFASTVYEASGRLGGRMFSNNGGYWDAGQVSEWCGELIDTGHKTIRDLAARYALPLDDLHAAEPNKSTETYLFDGSYYPFDQAVADFADVSDALAADLANAPFPTLYNSYTADGAELDHTSVYDWIESRVPGGHTAPFGQLLDVAYAIEYGADTAVQSSLNLIYLLGFQPKNDFVLFGQSDERFHIRGGNQQLPLAIAADLGPDVVKTGYSLVRLAETPNGRYTCTFARGGGTVEVTSDFVVLAIPFAVLAGIDTSGAGFDALKNTAIQQLGRGHNGKLQLQFGARTWLGKGPWPGKANGSSYADTGYQNTWEVTRAQPGTPGILVMYSGGSVTDGMKTTTPYTTASDPDVVSDARRGLRQLAPVYPDLSWNGKATQSLPHKSPFFNASYSYWKTGQYTEFAGYERHPLGGVYFCGEHTSIDFQGYMEGGAKTGKHTANKLAKVLT